MGHNHSPTVHQIASSGQKSPRATNHVHGRRDRVHARRGVSARSARTSSDTQDGAKQAEMKVRSLTGVGATKAIVH
ncbi:hypothetical protein GCM10009722_32800 [Williamsia deligens]